MPNPVINRRLTAIGASGSGGGGGGAALVSDWVRRVGVNGGAAPAAGSQSAATTFGNSLSAAGLISKIYVAHIFDTSNLIACKTPFIISPGAQDPCESNSAGTDGRIANTGWNVTTTLDAFFSSFLNPNSLLASLNDSGFVLYIASGSVRTSANGAYWGAENSGTGTRFALTTDTSKNLFGWCGKVSVGVSFSVLAANGFISVQRTSSTALNFYFANSTNAHSSLGSSSTADTGALADINNQAYFGISSVNGGLGGFDQSQIYSFFAATHGLTSVDDANLYNAVQALRTSLGGGFV